MCDYSLEHKRAMEAEQGMRIVSTYFIDTVSRGFTTSGNPDDHTAVCLRPGTELAFDKPVTYERHLRPLVTESCVARFTEIDVDEKAFHHDMLEFASGERVLVTLLYPGQIATVVQLPSEKKVKEQAQETIHLDVVKTEVIAQNLRCVVPEGLR